MSRRVDQAGTSDITRRFRVTQEESDEMDATAEYLGLTFSDYMRECHAARRRALVGEGKRPPLRPRDK